MKRSEAIRTIETLRSLIDLHYIHAHNITIDIIKQRNIKLDVEFFKDLTECAKKAREISDIKELVDFILDNECTDLANELRIIERRFDFVSNTIDNILCCDNIPEKMKFLLFDYKSEISCFGHDLQLLNHIWTISEEEATQEMHRQDWKEMREADTKQTSWEYIDYQLNKVKRIVEEHRQPTDLIISEEAETTTQKEVANDWETLLKFQLKSSDYSNTISKLYDFLINDGLFETDNLSIEQFFDLVGEADFRRFYNEKQKYRTKVRHIIHFIDKNEYYPKEWFEQACKLLNLEPKEMRKHSGIPQQWIRKWEKHFPKSKAAD